MIGCFATEEDARACASNMGLDYWYISPAKWGVGTPKVEEPVNVIDLAKERRVRRAGLKRGWVTTHTAHTIASRATRVA